MPIVDPNEEIEKLKGFDSIPLVCAQCGFQTTISQPSAPTLDALYEISSLQELKQELVMLQRTKSLFDRFPDSRHPQKIGKECLNKEDRPKMESDPEFEAALNADPELKAFLGSRLFWLSGRLEAVKEMIARQERPGLFRLECTNCADGYFCIEPKFAQRILWMT